MNSSSKLHVGLLKFSQLIPVMVLMWVYLFVRLHNIENMPYFIDELNHIDRARIIYSFSDLHVSTTPGKFLLYYWLGLFELPANLPGWIARTATVIVLMLGAAGTYALGRVLFGHWAGLLSLALLTVFPFMLFHERLALTDPLAASFVVLVAWWSVVFVKEPTKFRATVLAAFICLMLLAKILAGPVIMMPVGAILLLSASRVTFNRSLIDQVREAWQRYRQPLLRVVWINAAIWTVILVFYVGRGLIDPDNTNPIVDDYIFIADDRAGQLEQNLTHLDEMFSTLWGTGLVLLTVVTAPVALWKRPRRTLYLVSAILALWIPVFVLSARPNSRYFTVVGHLWLVVVAGGMVAWWNLSQRWPMTMRALVMLPVVGLFAWSLEFGTAFTATYIDEPTELDLPEAELNGYFRNFTGFALQDSLYYAMDLPPLPGDGDQVVIAGMTRGCDFLTYHIPQDHNLTIECLGRYTKADDMERIFATHGDVYAIVEQVEPITRIVDRRWVSGRFAWLASFDRPHDGVQVYVYLLHDTGWPIGGVRPSLWD